ncbi:hypothetical protein TTRE_0000775001 [Trichuris trichiura]|uniref:Uncharacterized protein n=1 Tax=Trichuris trichiura TaxID=36087 RepID=A0A077ZGD7_TRITR|nr:hypothetical protein TTRE_0000775001 [Trichuris trichiura]
MSHQAGNYLLQELCPDAAPGSAPSKPEPIKRSRGGDKESIDSAPEELTEDDLLEMTDPEMLPGNEGEVVEEAVPENKLTLDNLARGF